MTGKKEKSVGFHGGKEKELGTAALSSNRLLLDRRGELERRTNQSHRTLSVDHGILLNPVE